MVRLYVPPFLDWEILQEGAGSQWGFTPLKSSEPKSPWPWLWQTLPVLALSFLGPLPPFFALPCSLWTRAALLMSFTRQHNQGCFKVSTVQAQQVVLEQHSNSSSAWPFLFLHEKRNSIWSLGTWGNYRSDCIFMQARQIHLWMLSLRQDLTLDYGPYSRL